MKKSGLSILEILVATMILAICLLGFANIFVASKRKLAHSRYRMVACELSEFFLEPLHSDVRQDTWNTNCLGNASGCFTGVITLDNIPYTPSYTFSSLGPETRVNKVKITLTWPEL